MAITNLSLLVDGRSHLFVGPDRAGLARLECSQFNPIYAGGPRPQLEP